ncbi:hypothetical protein [Rhodothermus profundi]|uniref:CRISPR-associated protein, Cst1 family n=1 Tax=Rhodothermus profundi TaxID=633813 RepID=A0A1M6V556_9BACT|nr:hypothetical protein [Rhodothermus profundi]SHK76573.1 CRISPR-associated protein, Cst1 family [Rhodothermus profundi]
METLVGLRWTGHALIDMGVAVVVLATGNERPEEVTQRQWEQWMDELEQDYQDKYLQKPCSILFTLNAFDNPSWSKKPEERAQKITRTFESARNAASLLAEACTFFPERPAVVRAARDLFPMLMGQQQLNFYPNGRSELPLSALALGCVLSLPRVAPIVSGRAMIVGADDPELLLDLCEYWKEDLDRELALLRAGGAWKDRKAPRTRLLEALEEVFGPGRMRRFASDERLSGVTLYHLSNSGNGPAVDLYTVRPLVNRFLARAEAAAHHPRWKALVRAFWRRPKDGSYEQAIVQGKKKKGAAPLSAEERLQARNDVYELLPALPEKAARFVKHVFLGFAQNRVGQRRDFRTDDIDIWPLVELFLTELMPTMTPERIETIRRLADELAHEIHANNDRRLYRQLMGLVSGMNSYGAFRALLIRAIRERLRRTNQLLLSFDDYLLLFEEGEGFPRADWRLVRDLVRIRVLEQLHRAGFFAEAPELLEEVPEEEEVEEET